jgi:hypothetical protein
MTSRVVQADKRGSMERDSARNGVAEVYASSLAAAKFSE